MAKQCGFLLFLVATSSLALAAAVEGAARGDAKAQADLSIIQNLKEPEHLLTVCNAYAADEPLHVDILRLSANTAELAYKECRDLHSQLQAEDTVEFKLGEDVVGSFAVSEVPAVTSKLLLVAHRRSGSMTATFKSHVFTPDSIELAEVAVLDVLGEGVKGHKVQIQNAQKPKAKGGEEDGVQLMQHAPEELTLNAVSPIRSGEFKVSVPGSMMDLKASG